MVAKPNLNFINGMRCTCCIWIVFLHCHVFTAPHPYKDPSMVYIREFPILGFFATSTLAVDIFWLISGFLCSYQLNSTIDYKKPLWPVWFLLNRLLRIYPLYLIGILMNFGTSMAPHCKFNDIPALLKCVFMSEIYFLNTKTINLQCAGAGWTLSVDMIGYIIILFVFCLFFNKNANNNKHDLSLQLQRQKTAFWLMFIGSGLVSIYYCYTYKIDWPVGVFSLEIADKEMIEHFRLNNEELGIPIPDLYNEYFPDFDHYSPENISWRERNANWCLYLYFSSVYAHGAVMLLGAVLAIQLKQREIAIKKKEQQIGVCNCANLSWGSLLVWNILPIVVSFAVVHDLKQDVNYRHYLWTAIYDKLFALGFFKLMDTLLQISLIPDEHEHVAKTTLNFCCGNRILKHFNKFTFIIYLFHTFVIFSMFFMVLGGYPIDEKNTGVGLKNYGFIYLFQLTFLSVFVTFLFSIVMYYLIEYPISWFRYEYIRPKYSIDSKVKHQ